MYCTQGVPWKEGRKKCKYYQKHTLVLLGEHEKRCKENIHKVLERVDVESEGIGL
jgi:hypothetical protein